MSALAFEWDELRDDAHKGRAGTCLCVVGSRLMPGAAILVARAAQRAGAGLVAVGCFDRALLRIVPVAAPEAILVDLRDAKLAGDARPALLALTARAPDAILVGPGLGATPRTRDAVDYFRDDAAGTPLVLDADALGVLAGEPEAARRARGPLVLTPHPGEAARLLGRDVPAASNARLAAARELAERARATVCLKGHATIVTDGEREFVATTGNSGMATAGAGDVLAGVLVAYLARRAALGRSLGPADVFAIAARAVHVHGRAGDIAAADLGRRGLIASDLIDALPEAQRELEER